MQQTRWPIRWGDPDKGFDAQPLTLAGDGHFSDEMTADLLAKAGYLAKYATKSTEATGHTSTRITAERVDDYADPQGDHIARLIDACWHLGRPTHTPAPLAHRPVPHPEPGNRRTPFDTPWTCQDCGTRTRYAACPACTAERQASLDAEPARTTTGSNPYARLRRWAHMLGYGGHFLTKARRYSTTFGDLRTARTTYRRDLERGHHQQTDAHPGHAVAGLYEDDTPLLVGALTFAGAGWHTTGDALLANTAAALARERQAAGREELAHELSYAVLPALAA